MGSLLCRLGCSSWSPQYIRYPRGVASEQLPSPHLPGPPYRRHGLVTNRSLTSPLDLTHCCPQISLQRNLVQTVQLPRVNRVITGTPLASSIGDRHRRGTWYQQLCPGRCTMGFGQSPSFDFPMYNAISIPPGPLADTKTCSAGVPELGCGCLGEDTMLMRMQIQPRYGEHSSSRKVPHAYNRPCERDSQDQLPSVSIPSRAVKLKCGGNQRHHR